MKKAGIILPPMPISQAVAAARRAEEMGFHSVWTYELSCYSRDPIVVLTAVAQATSAIKIGIACLNPFLRLPSAIAMTYATMEELAPGRMIIGLGVGDRNFTEPLGLWTPKTHTAVREAVHLMRRLLAREEVTFDGKVFHANRVRLFRDLPVDSMCGRNVPIFLVYQMSLKFAKLCGELGDGTFGPIGKPRSYLKRLRDAAKEGALEAGRKESDLVYANNFPTAVGKTREDGHKKLARHPWMHHAVGITSQYHCVHSNPTHSDPTGMRKDATAWMAWEEAGMDPKLSCNFFDAHTKGDFETATRIILDSPAPETMAISGDRESVAEQIADWVKSVGLDLPVLAACFTSEDEMNEILAAGRLYAESK